MFLGGHIGHLHCRCGVASSIDVKLSIFGRVRTFGIGAGVEGGLVWEGLHQIMAWIPTSQMLWLGHDTGDPQGFFLATCTHGHHRFSWVTLGYVGVSVKNGSYLFKLLYTNIK